MVIKRISTTVTIQGDGPDEPSEPAPLARADSVRSEISDIDMDITPADAQRFQDEVQDMRNRTVDEFILDPRLTNQTEIITISEMYIDEKT